MTGVAVLSLMLVVAGCVAIAQETDDKLPALGAELFRAKGCVACHGSAGLPLDGIATYSDDDILGVLASPPAGMPVFELAANEQNALLAYLRITFGTPKEGGEEK